MSVFQLKEVIWIDKFVEKITRKHQVTMSEVEEVLFSEALFRLAEKGRIKGENLYAVYGKTSAGRYLIVLLIRKQGNIGVPISARDMTDRERKYYNAQRKNN